MHELSIALSLIDVAGDEARRQGAVGVSTIHLKLGPLSGVVREALLSAYELAREQDELLRDSRLVIEDVPVVVRCATCDADRPVVSIQEMRCATCGTPSPDVVAGRDLEVVAMEISQ